MAQANKETDPKKETSTAPEPDAVVVYRVKDEENNIQVTFDTVGNVEQLEIPAILSIATKVAKARLGVD